jgi:hypothetical protein
MPESIQSQTDVSADQDRVGSGFVHIESIVGVPGDKELAGLAEPYRHCEGTWTEFKGDVKRFFRRIGKDTRDRAEDLQESFSGAFHRKRPQEATPPTQ